MTTASSHDGKVTYFQIEKHYQQSEEWEAAMMFLDKKDVPRTDSRNGLEYTLVGRIEAYKKL